LSENPVESLNLSGWPAGSLSEDHLLGGAVRLCQPRDGFRAAIDTVLMAAAVPAGPGERVFEAGSGSGAAAICLARRVPQAEIAGIEIQPQMVTLAGHNIRLNGLARKVVIMTGDIAAPPPPMLQGPFDHAMANPPFLEDTDGNVPADPVKARATTLGETALADWVSGVHVQLRNKGTFTLVWRADRMDQAIAALRPRFGDICLYPLWPKEGRPAKRVLIRARKGVKSPMTLLPGLTIHREDGGYTEEGEAVLKGGAALSF